MQIFLKKSVIILIIIMLGNMLTYNFASAASTENAIQIDGYYDDWTSLPYSWEYPDSSGKEDGSEDNIENKHQMSLILGDQDIFLHIKLATKEKAGINSENFRFFINGQMKELEVTYVGGEKIKKNDDKKIGPGTYALEVRDQGSTIDGAGYYTIYGDDENNELEVRISLSALGGEINNIQTIEFFSPHLMHRYITCYGVSTSPYLGIGICIIVVAGTLIISRRFIRSKKV